MTRTLLLTLVFLACTTAASFGKTIVVSVNRSLCSDATYTSIQAAVNDASPGDTLNVCPGTYNEQVTIAKPLTIRGITKTDQDRVQIQPSTLAPVSGTSTLAVVSVLDTPGVYLWNLAIDASQNGVSGCTPALSAVHFLNASGALENDAVSGAEISNPSSCATLTGNGIGVLLESTGSGNYAISVEHSSIHDFTKDGVRGTGSGLTAKINGNVISGLGPAGGFSFQFGVFVLNGALGLVTGNQITEGDCGSLSVGDCINARSEGVVLRAVANGSLIDHNIVSRAQSGIFINFANNARITNNLVDDIGPLDGIDAQGMSNSLVDSNSIFNATPTSNQSCGIAEAPGQGSAGGVEANNTIVHTLVNDAWCGVAFAPSTHISGGQYYNVVFTQFRSDLGPPASAP